MPSAAFSDGWSTPTEDGAAAEAPKWRDPKRYLWLLSTIVPGLISASWLAVFLTGSTVFWWAGLLATFGMIPALDWLLGPDTKGPPDSAVAWLDNDPFYRWATYLYLPIQYLSLAMACWLWAGGGWLTMNGWDKLGLMFTVGIVGGCAINVAHHLGHGRARAEKRLCKIALAQTFYGHFFVEHSRGHHVHLATPEDPTSALVGQSLYAFIPRSMGSSVVFAWRAESKRLARRGDSRWSMRNDALNAWALSAILFVVLVVWFGVTILPWLVGQAIVGLCLLEAVNYVEHYGLRRQKLPNGRYEKVRITHSWNSVTVASNIFLFNLQRHSDHHAYPMRRYQALRHQEDAPQLPTGYAAMVMLATIPPLWRRVMDRRVLQHYGGDISLAALTPRLEARSRTQTARHAVSRAG